MEFLVFLTVFVVSVAAVVSLIFLLTMGHCLSCGLTTYLAETHCPVCKKSRLQKELGDGLSPAAFDPFTRARRKSGVLTTDQVTGSNESLYWLVVSLAILVGGVYFFVNTSLLPQAGKVTSAQASRSTGATTGSVIGDRARRMYYPAGCADYSKIPLRNKAVFTSVENARQAGYKPAGGCP